MAGEQAEADEVWFGQHEERMRCCEFVDITKASEPTLHGHLSTKINDLFDRGVTSKWLQDHFLPLIDSGTRPLVTTFGKFTKRPPRAFFRFIHSSALVSMRGPSW